MKIVGIDPGKSGGLAIIENSNVNYSVMPLADADYKPMTYREAQRLDRKLPKSRKHFVKDLIPDCLAIREFILQADEVFIEKQQVRVRQKGQLAVGANYGMIIGVCLAMGKYPRIITPRTWQKWVSSHLPDEYDDTKDMSRAYVHMNGIEEDHDGITDAICIGKYGKYVIGMA